MDTIIINFLTSLPVYFLSIIVMVLVFLVDMFYALWARRVAEGRPLSASIYSVAIYICSVTAFTGILEISNLLIIPGIIGAFLGTYITVLIDNRKTTITINK